jgi:uncharacterized protein
MTLPWTVLCVSALAAFAVGLGKGGLASMGTFGVPLMAMVMSPLRGAAILLPVFVFSDLFALYLYRHDCSRRNVKILIPAAAIGIGLAWFYAPRVSDRVIDIGVGLIGLSFCATALRARLAPPRAAAADLPRGFVWGAVLGFVSFISHAGAPAFQVYVQPQRLPKVTYAGTSAIVFAAVNGMKLVPYWAIGQFSAANLQLSLALCVPALVGTQVGKHVVRRVSQRAYDRFLLMALCAVSIQLIVKGLRLLP